MALNKKFLAPFFILSLLFSFFFSEGDAGVAPFICSFQGGSLFGSYTNEAVT